MQKLICTIVSMAMLSGCVDAPSDDNGPSTHEGEAPVGQEVQLKSATYDGFSLAVFGGKELFRGIILADGPVARNIPSIRDHLALENNLHDPSALQSARQLHERILTLIERDQPQLFSEFEQSILSGDHVEISDAVNRGRAAARAVLPEAQAELSLATDEKCVIAVVVVAAVAVHVAVAVNHALAAETVWVTGVTTGEPGGDVVSVDGDTQSLLVSELADDVASKTKVAVWEFTSPTKWTTATSYTDKTKHQLYIGDFDGDGQKDDRFYYSPGGENDELISIGSGDFIAHFDLTTQPQIGDFDGDKVDDVLFYEPGSVSHYIWFFKKTTSNASTTFIRYTSQNIVASKSTKPVVGDFDNNGRSEILWYAPGAGVEYLWRFGTDRKLESLKAPTQVNGSSYKPLTGDFVGDKADDIMWYCPGECSDPMWQHVSGSFTPKGLTYTANGSIYKPFVFDFDNNGKDDLVWYAPGDNDDVMWRFNSDGTGRFNWHTFTVNGSYDPAVGKIAANKHPTIFWWPDR